MLLQGSINRIMTISGDLAPKSSGGIYRKNRFLSCNLLILPLHIRFHELGFYFLQVFRTCCWRLWRSPIISTTSDSIDVWFTAILLRSRKCPCVSWVTPGTVPSSACWDPNFGSSWRGTHRHSVVGNLRSELSWLEGRNVSSFSSSFLPVVKLS